MSSSHSIENEMSRDQPAQRHPAHELASRGDALATKKCHSNENLKYFVMPGSFVEQFQQWQMETFGGMVSEWLDLATLDPPKNCCPPFNSLFAFQDQQPPVLMSNNCGILQSELYDSSLSSVDYSRIDLPSSSEAAAALIASLSDESTSSSTFPCQSGATCTLSMPFHQENENYSNTTVGVAACSAATQSSCLDDLFISNFLSSMSGDALSQFGMLSTVQPTDGIMEQLVETSSSNFTGQTTIGSNY
ncbi:uncharacterized protein LOC134183741 [Corticium candelabrum]|uniref:uncharacterized protein LOC134183741 n=1 Tax=Corticium candelabrum TaxID=121492 RepID=UPI002E26F419|nr:uncharacterized protein LOC134183741 [Corticium candelabrum]